MKPIRTKICGITRTEDAVSTHESGADAIGLNFYERSKRFVSPELARTIAESVSGKIAVVGVFVNSTVADICEIVALVGLSHVQFHGDEEPSIVAELKANQPETKSIRAVRIMDNDFEKAQSEIDQWQDAGVDAILLDAASAGSFGGTGNQLDWDSIERLKISVPWLLAGGLNPDNVAMAIAACEPGGVDVASGVESGPGIKNATLVRKFVSESKPN
ncbi:phosphoribosylanthranilate isomerase [Mariniblastus fucicola]|uniref:N-(5'-phosphoribosyl)anthranilate isomerase n=1 Tax=Mariniblastus fucicola TaxID=980251 RepID=A0A5B9P6C5_9BACT|nr:phosphoribosylanthranilate isomerase [Mariniblastus fucicola]QEG21824.1 N-(5'-phosphoribosyl)anthranilate isomerase [Mariniblastus fucicola]